MLELVFNSEFSDAMQARFPVITPERTAADFTDLAGWSRNAKGGRWRWWRGEQFSIYRSLNQRWRWLVRRVEDVPYIGECGQSVAEQRTYFSVKSFGTVQDAIADVARSLGITRAEV